MDRQGEGNAVDMELLRIVSSMFILFSAGMTLLMGVEQLTGRAERARYHTILFVLSVPVSIILVNHVLFGNGITPRHPWSAFLYLTSIYTIGPLTNMYYHFLMYPGRRIRPKKLLRFVPAGLMLVTEVALQAGWTAEEKRRVLDELFNAGGFSFLLPLVFVGGTIFVTYQVMVVIEALQLWNDSRIKHGARLVILLELMNITLPVPIILWMFIRSHYLFLVSGLVTAFVMTTVFLANNRFPRIFNLMSRELGRRKYERSFLKGIDTESIRERLLSLMEEEKAYRDSDLTLQSLASTMKLSPHQLSQFLNEKMRTGFTRFINKYRVAEAKSLLAQNRDHTVLNICYFVGFRSKSSFNTIFKSFTGQTPTDYRKSLD